MKESELRKKVLEEREKIRWFIYVTEEGLEVFPSTRKNIGNAKRMSDHEFEAESEAKEMIQDIYAFIGQYITMA